MTSSPRRTSSSIQQPHSSAVGKRKRSSSYGAANVTPPKRQSIGHVNEAEDTTPIRHPKPRQRDHIHATPDSSRRRGKATTNGMYSFERPGDHGRVFDLTSSPSAEDVQRIKMNITKSGPRKLVVKNLRAEQAWDVNKYLDQTWTQLDATLTKIFDDQLNSYSIDQMYTGVENLCRQGKGSTLYSRLKSSCQKRLKDVLKSCVASSNGQTSHVSVLRGVIGAWRSWQTQMVRRQHLIKNLASIIIFLRPRYDASFSISTDHTSCRIRNHRSMMSASGCSTSTSSAQPKSVDIVPKVSASL